MQIHENNVFTIKHKSRLFCFVLSLKLHDVVMYSYLVFLMVCRMSDVILKDWMDESDIFSKVYRGGVRYFISFAVRYGYSKSICACPCNKCRNTNTGN